MLLIMQDKFTEMGFEAGFHGFGWRRGLKKNGKIFQTLGPEKEEEHLANFSRRMRGADRRGTQADQRNRQVVRRQSLAQVCWVKQTVTSTSLRG